MTFLASDDIVETWADAASASRPPLIVLESLLAHLDACGLGDGEAPTIVPIGDGLSNATFALSYDDGRELILRRPPRGRPVPGRSAGWFRNLY